MLDIYVELKKIINKFNAANIDYALCGGWALIIYGCFRAAEDIEILIKPEDFGKAQNIIENLGFTFKSYPLHYTESKIQSASKSYVKDFLILDLIYANDTFASVLIDKKIILWENLKLSIVSKTSLIKLKENTGRGKDLIDIEELKKLDEE